MLREIVGDRRKCSWSIDIVAIEVSKDIAGRAGQAFVDSMHLAAILFTLPVRQLRRKFADNLYALIGAAAVNHHVLEIRVVLIEHRADSLFQELSLVERGSDNTNLRRHASNGQQLLGAFGGHS